MAKPIPEKRDFPVSAFRYGLFVFWGYRARLWRRYWVGVLPIGYADGYIRAYGNGGYVSFGGRKAPIAGRVCMDQVMVDVTDLPDVKEGDTAVLFGDETVTADTAAKWLNTINYEVTCLISPRVPRVYKG